jgi:ribosomal protein L14E/L6E/L27E
VFIDNLSVVDIVAGRYAGRRGVVEKIRIVSATGAVMVCVNVFNQQTGGVDLMVFDPLDVKKARLKPLNIERLQILAQISAAENEAEPVAEKAAA